MQCLSAAFTALLRRLRHTSAEAISAIADVLIPMGNFIFPFHGLFIKCDIRAFSAFEDQPAPVLSVGIHRLEISGCIL